MSKSQVDALYVEIDEHAAASDQLPDFEFADQQRKLIQKVFELSPPSHRAEELMELFFIHCFLSKYEDLMHHVSWKYLLYKWKFTPFLKNMFRKRGTAVIGRLMTSIAQRKATDSISMNLVAAIFHCMIDRRESDEKDMRGEFQSWNALIRFNLKKGVTDVGVYFMPVYEGYVNAFNLYTFFQRQYQDRVTPIFMHVYEVADYEVMSSAFSKLKAIPGVLRLTFVTLSGHGGVLEPYAFTFDVSTCRCDPGCDETKHALSMKRGEPAVESNAAYRFINKFLHSSGSVFIDSSDAANTKGGMSCFSQYVASFLNPYIKVYAFDGPQAECHIKYRFDVNNALVISSMNNELSVPVYIRCPFGVVRVEEREPLQVDSAADICKKVEDKARLTTSRMAMSHLTNLIPMTGDEGDEEIYEGSSPKAESVRPEHFPNLKIKPHAAPVKKIKDEKNNSHVNFKPDAAPARKIEEKENYSYDNVKPYEAPAQKIALKSNRLSTIHEVVHF